MLGPSLCNKKTTTTEYPAPSPRDYSQGVQSHKSISRIIAFYLNRVAMQFATAVDFRPQSTPPPHQKTRVQFRSDPKYSQNLNFLEKPNISKIQNFESPKHRLSLYSYKL